MLSAAVHLGVLALLLVHFSLEPKFEDAQEAVPVETITDAQFSQIMKGEKSAKEVAAKPRVDRVARVEEQKPTPPTPQAQKDVPAPPPPLKRLPDPVESSEPPPPPPVRPVEPKPTPTPKPAPKPPEKAEPEEEPEKDDAEPVKPPPRPKPPEKKVETKPEPPKPPTPPTPPKPQEKPTPKPPKLDEVAKLLSQSNDGKANDKPSDKPAKPKSGEESNARPSPNLSEVSKLLSHEAAQSQGSAGREVSHAASLGAASGHAAKMSPSMANAFDGFLRERYKQCWNYLSFSDTPRYVPKIRVAFRQDGSLAATPVLLNPPADPAARSLADSALRAVRSCDPMKIPAQFAPFYEQWKDSTVAFNPQD
nr:cell envelope biogenesis protein TolA [Rhodoblastus sphagnicola]